MNCALIGCAVALTAWLAAGQARCADFYVAPTGNDNAQGSRENPWKTIQKAADTLQAGDTVYVHAGIYQPVTVHVSGSAAGGAVTFRNAAGETPVIDGTGIEPPEDDTGLFLLTDRQYVTISGFELRNYRTRRPAPTPAGIFLRGACAHIRISGCNIHDIANTGGVVKNSGNAFGLAVYGSSPTPATDITIDGNDLHDLKTGASESLAINGNVTHCQVTHNRVHDNNNIGILFVGFEGTCVDTAQDQARDSVCADNTVWNISSENNQAYPRGDFSADGLYCDGSTRITLERNVVRGCDIGVELASEHAGRLTSAITLRHNVISGNREGGLFLGGYAKRGTGGTADCLVANNTFYHDDTRNEDNGELQLRFRTSGCLIQGNIFAALPEHFFVTVPVVAGENLRNRFDHNWYTMSSAESIAAWIWNNATLTGFAAWKVASGQDAHSFFGDPRFIRESQPPDPHLRANSPAHQAAVGAR